MKNAPFGMKFGTHTNSTMLSSILMSIFRISFPKIPILGVFGPKMKNARFGMKFGLIQYVELNVDFGSEFNCSLKESVDIMISVEGVSKHCTHPNSVKKKSLFTLKIMLGLSVKAKFFDPI